MGWSWRRVRTGRWAHVDASAADERRSLHRFLLPVLAAAAILALRATPGVSAYLALSALIVAAAVLSSRWCKLSLHAAFAVFCALMLLRWSAWAGAAALAFATAVLWSRLALARHRPRDLFAGIAAGAAAAALSWPLVPQWPAP
nr:phosphatase PAP2 family protein [Luteimonas salinisoli]